MNQSFASTRQGHRKSASSIRFEYLSFIAVELLLRTLPLSLAYRLSESILFALFKALPRLRKRVDENLNTAFPESEENKRIALDHIRYQAWFWADMLLAPVLIHARLMKTRIGYDRKEIPKTGALRRVHRALSNKVVVGVQIDQDAAKTGSFIPFFGKPASTHTGPALAALLSDSVVLSLFRIRVEERQFKFKIHVRGPYRASDFERNQHGACDRGYRSVLSRVPRAEPLGSSALEDAGAGTRSGFIALAAQ